MYEERKNFSIKDTVIQLFLVVLFVFIMIWLFPTKNYLANTYATKDDVNVAIDEALDSRLEFLYGRVYADNIATMQTAATNYFTDSRMPKTVGDSIKITLEEMLSKKLLVTFKDSNNKICDLEDSYVKVTKMDEEYEMRIKLNCSDYSDYVIVYLGCHDYCNDCDKKQTTTTIKKQTTSKQTEKKPTPVVAKKYKYRLTTQNEYSNWSSWSSWSTNSVSSSVTKQVEMDIRKISTGGYQGYGIIGYERVYSCDKYPGYKPVEGNPSKCVKITSGYIPTKDTQLATEITDTKAATATTTGGGYTAWAYQGDVTSNTALSTSVSSNSTVRYTYISHKTTYDCNNACKWITTYTYKKETRRYVSGNTTYSCSKYPGYTLSGKNCVSTTYSCSKYPGYTLSGKNCVGTINKYYEYSSSLRTAELVIDYSRPIYGSTGYYSTTKKVTYYRYRTRKLISKAKTVYEVSNSANDKTLLKLGYVLIGEV